MVLNLIDKKIVLTETGGVQRDAEYVRIGIPFAQGELLGQAGLIILNHGEEPQPVQTSILKRWNDGSVKWALFDFAASVPANGRSIYRLVKSDGKLPPNPSGIDVIQNADSWQISTGLADFTIDAREFRPFSRVRIADQEILRTDAAFCALDINKNNRLVPKIESIAVETMGALRVTLCIKGSFSPSNLLSAQFFSRLHFFAGSSLVTLEFTLRNPQPAQHPGGLWDLGDPGSLFFRELAFVLPFAAGQVNKLICSPGEGLPALHSDGTFNKLSIYQESSGGINWRSPNHRNRNGEVPFNVKGYEMHKGNERVAVGDRAVPVFWCGGETMGAAAVLPRFWQEFPKAIEADQSDLRIGLFPSRYPESHELQGGEQKTTTVYLDFATSADGLAWARAPLQVAAVPEVYQSSGAIADLPLQQTKESAADLIDQFIAGPELLAERRELTDEYGWRNFGELTADHESVYHQGKETFISHYNNQYDICAGMYRKFFATGNPLWGSLASALAEHVLDIDLYHTSRDREEYNGGLFWHTDHYIPAGLSTHRSFSGEHLQSKDPRFCGGGPAAEHCYTTGLLYNYFMTGNNAYRDAVINLAEWCIRSLAGSQTILESIKRGSRYIKLLLQARSGAKPAFPRYPLSRGTGNAIIACLDAFEAGGGSCFLAQAEEFLRGAIHPGDDICTRDLLDAENAWSYTVLLVAVTKYIEKKSELEEFDDGYLYARTCLLTYAEWMLKNEYPYLEKPEILEYPNETWPAQDLRKSVILFKAAGYAAPQTRKALYDKARLLFDASRDGLARHPTSCFVRPVALMLQNGWIGSRLDEQKTVISTHELPVASFGKPTPQLGIFSVTARICGEMWQAARKFNPGRELAWLNKRLQSRRSAAVVEIPSP